LYFLPRFLFTAGVLQKTDLSVIPAFLQSTLPVAVQLREPTGTGKEQRKQFWNRVGGVQYQFSQTMELFIHVEQTVYLIAVTGLEAPRQL
jgi:hypothetical protein